MLGTLAWVSDSVTGCVGLRYANLAYTAVAVAFTPQTRRLRLLKGETYFEVRRDENKPFVVDSEDTQTVVLGTRFIVRDGDAEDKITVLQGLVQVSNKARKQQVLLRADEQVASSAFGLTAIQRLASPHETGWLQDRLSFQDAPLADVVNDLDRYIPGIIVFSNRSVKTYRINARFDITQPVRALDTLAETLPIKITHVGDWLTVIGRK